MVPGIRGGRGEEPSPTVKIRLRNDHAEIERLEEHVTAFATDHALPERSAYGLHLALEEVVSNIISYAWDDGGEHLLHVTMEVQDGKVLVQVEDDGKPFDPLATPPPDLDIPLEEREAGGFGIYLTRHFMDDVTYERRQDRNILTLVKAI